MTFSWMRNGVPVAGQEDADLVIVDPTPEDGGSYTLMATAAVGATATSPAAAVVVLDSDPAALQDAVETTAIAFETAGPSRWGRQTPRSADGTDAAQTGPQIDGVDSRLDGVVNGPAIVRWQHSYADFGNSRDAYRVLIDGSIVFEGQGTRADFHEHTVGIPAGRHVISWLLFNPQITRAHAAIDQVEILPADSGPPVFSLEPPALADGVEGVPLLLQTEALGAPDINYQWFRDGAPIPGANSPTLEVTESGIYRVEANNGEGTASSRDSDAFFHDTAAIDAALDNGLEVTNSGDAGWRPQRSEVQEGDTALMAGAIGNGERSTVTATGAGRGRISFRWRTSCERTYDALVFRIDGVEVERVSGDLSDWQERTFFTGDGEHTFEWSFLKDAGNAHFADTAYLDDVEFTTAQSSSSQFFLDRNPVREAVVKRGGFIHLDAFIDDRDGRAQRPFQLQWLQGRERNPGRELAPVFQTERHRGRQRALSIARHLSQRRRDQLSLDGERARESRRV